MHRRSSSNESGRPGRPAITGRSPSTGRRGIHPRAAAARTAARPRDSTAARGPALVVWAALAGLLLCCKGGAAAAGVVHLGGSIDRAADGRLMASAHVTIAPGYHINAHRPAADHLIPTELTLTAPGARFAPPVYPEPIAREFAFSPGEKLLVYDGRIEIRAPVEEPPAGPVLAKLRFQACDEERCLPPATVEATFGRADAAAPPGDAAGGASAGSQGSSWLTRWLEQASLPAAIAMSLVLGLTLNLTPCVYPLISVTVAYFGSQARPGERPWRHAVAYVLGITASFAVLGSSAALFGGLIGAPLQHPAVPIAVAALLLALAGSSFGLFELRPPAALLQRLGGASVGIGGALLMGLTMGVVAAPCIGPVIVGLLVFVGAKRDLALGLLLFLSLGLGMGLPYLLLASAAGSIRRLPRSGEWLRWVNRLFGVILVGMALYFLAPLLGPLALRVLVPAYLALAGLYLGFLEPSGRGLKRFSAARHMLGLGLVAAAGWIALVGTEPSAQARDRIRWEPLSVDSLDRAIAARRPAIVEFAADWCMPCVAMARTTFVDPDVTREAARFAMLQADVTESTPASEALLSQFQILGVPTILFYGPAGEEVDRVVGFVDAERFLGIMRRVAGGDAEPPANDQTERAAGDPSLSGFGEERRQVVAAEGDVLATNHVGAQRVDLEPGRKQMLDQVGAPGRHEEAHVGSRR